MKKLGGLPMLAFVLDAGIMVVAIVVLAIGCSRLAHKQDQAKVATHKNEASLQEESRALTTGALDALGFAPTNPPTDLARGFLRRDQQIEGLPVERIPVPEILEGLKPALDYMQRRFDAQDALLRERQKLEVELNAAREKLEAMGKLYEQEKNKRIVRRIWEWAIGTFGIGGVIALVIFCPAVIPLLGAVVGKIVEAVPSLVSFFGVVSKKAFDATVRGVGEARKALSEKAPDAKSIVDLSLAKSQDESHKRLIAARRSVMRV